MNISTIDIGKLNPFNAVLTSNNFEEEIQNSIISSINNYELSSVDSSTSLDLSSVKLVKIKATYEDTDKTEYFYVLSSNNAIA